MSITPIKRLLLEAGQSRIWFEYTEPSDLQEQKHDSQIISSEHGM
jgi:hypothetical protein